MFDWNNNGKHDFFDDRFTIGLIQHMIDESKEDKRPIARGKGKPFNTPYIDDNKKIDLRKDAITTFWLFLGLIVLIGGVILVFCTIQNPFLISLSMFVLAFISYKVMSQGFDKDD